MQSMRSLSASLACALVLLGLACAGPTAAPDNDGSVAESPPDAAVEVAKSPHDRSRMIPRIAGDAPHEVELDPRAEAALTIGKQGHLCLWPALRSSDPKLVAPYSLPQREPIWMSLAQADDGFVVALIDTSNIGQVFVVSPTADGSEAKLTPLFTTAPEDPLLEMHVLDGGLRVLALGVDHRVRLYDRSGALISVIDERGFAPWQLRVVHGAPGQLPQLAAILAQPVRVQAIELRDDRLSIVGEPRAVSLDRGPNRSDLVLGPDGNTVAALRRLSGRKSEFSIELIDLATDARRLVAGKSNATIRARMHFVDSERILLETGASDGLGLWVELAKAEPLADPADADPESKLAKRLYQTAHDSIPLPASAERRPQEFDPEEDLPWDRELRSYASVIDGLRVTVDRPQRSFTRLLVDPLDGDRHFVIGHGLDLSVGDHQGALDHTGTRMAEATSRTLQVIDLAIDSGGANGPLLDSIELIDHGQNHLLTLAFADETRVLLVDDKGHLQLFELPSGKVVATTQLDFGWSIDAIAYHGEGESGGVLGWRSAQPGEPVRLLTIAEARLGTAIELARADRPAWLDILGLGDAEAAALFGISETEADDVDRYTSARDGRLFHTKEFVRTDLFVRDGAEQTRHRLPAGRASQLLLSPDGSKLAVVQTRTHSHARMLRVKVDDDVLSVLDANTGERLWTMGPRGSTSWLSWSGDGTRIAIGAAVHDAATGELLWPRVANVTGHVMIEERSDTEFAAYREE